MIIDLEAHQRTGGSIIRKRAGELHAQPARSAGYQRHAALEAEHVRGFHATAVIHGLRNDME